LSQREQSSVLSVKAALRIHGTINKNPAAAGCKSSPGFNLLGNVRFDPKQTSRKKKNPAEAGWL
jgi:hypothetical protein